MSCRRGVGGGGRQLEVNVCGKYARQIEERREKLKIWRGDGIDMAPPWKHADTPAVDVE